MRVDTLGVVLKDKVPAAPIAAREGVRLLLEPLRAGFPRLRQVWVDMSSRGQILDWMGAHVGWRREGGKRPRR